MLNNKQLNKLSNVHFRQNILSAVWERLEGRCVRRLVLGLKKWWGSELKIGLKSSQRITLIALKDKQNDSGFWLGKLGRAHCFKRNGEDNSVSVKEEKKNKSEIIENVYMSNKQMKREDGISKGRSNRDKWLIGTDSRLRLLWL